MAGLGLDAHVDEGEADLTAHILAAVLGRYIHITGAVEGDIGGHAVFVLLKQVKFDLGAKIDVDAFGCRFIDRLLQDEPAVFFKLCAVWIHDIAVHAHDPPVHRPPGQDDQGGRVRFQKQIAFGGIAESGDRGSVEGDAFAEGAG